MKSYPGRLHHETPSWVKSGASFHIRIRIDPAQSSLLAPGLARDLLLAAKRYHVLEHWWCDLFLLMPDHLHAVLALPIVPGMKQTIRDWKRGTTRFQNVLWQEGFFDHRIRNPKERDRTWNYIRRNPVAKGLCHSEDDWPWWWSATVQNPLLPLDEEP